MKHVTALGLPEISTVIASYLSLDSLNRCSLVCHAWQVIFLPDLWRVFHTQNYKENIKDRRRLPPPPLSTAVLDSLKKNASLVRELEIQPCFVEQLQPVHLPNLRSLTAITRFVSVSREKEEAAWGDLIRRHCCYLETLTIRAGTYVRMPVIWDIIAERKRTMGEDERMQRQQQQQLRVLFVQNQVLDVEELEDEEVPEPLLLRYHFSNLKDNWIQSLTLTSCKPRSSNLDLLIITHCQQLRSLTWVQKSIERWTDREPAPFAKGLAEGLWPYLDTLELSLSSKEDDQFYAEVIENLGHYSPLKSLNVQNSTFGPRSTQALINGQGGRHRTSLERLVVRHCLGMKGTMVQQIMCSFPNLVLLHAPYLTELDIHQDPRPWVCLGLKDLSLCLYVPILGVDMDTVADTVTDTNTNSSLVYVVARATLPPAVPQPSTVFLDRIATLTQLESLNLASRDSAVPARAPASHARRLPNDLWTCPPIQLDDEVETDSDLPTGDGCGAGGLAQLGTLKQLRLFVPTSSGHTWTMREVQWMIMNWPCLNSLEYHSISAKSPDKELLEFLEQHGIEDNYYLFLFD